MQQVARQAPLLLLSMCVPTQPFPTAGTGKGFQLPCEQLSAWAPCCLFKTSPNWEVSILHHIFGNFFRARQVASLCSPLIPPCANLASRINPSLERSMRSCTWSLCYLLPSFPKFPITLCTLLNLRSSLWWCQLLLQMQNILNVYPHTHLLFSCILYLYFSVSLSRCLDICIYIYIYMWIYLCTYSEKNPIN